MSDWYNPADGFGFEAEPSPEGADRLRALLLPEGGEICGASCPCHGGVVCRLAPHAHGDPVTRPDGSMDTDTHPHVGMNADQSLVQWEHTGQHGPVLTEAQVNEALAAARRAHTYAVLDGIDLDVLREMTQSNLAIVEDHGSA
jgi:hypothetical protein